MFRMFDMLGRSTAMRAFDAALRAVGLHPLLVPDPVKLTAIELTRKLAAATPQQDAFADAAQVLAYAICGHGQFAENTSTSDAARADERFEAALDAGDTLDAKLILLALHAGLIAPEARDRIDLDDTDMDPT